MSAIWWGALFLFLLALLFRDGFQGRSLGKRIMAVTIRTPSGAPVGLVRSVARNLPLAVPGWNVIEVAMLFLARDGRRTGDRIARTSVVEE